MRPDMFAIVLAMALPWAAAGAERTLIGWEFESPGDLERWQPNGHLQDTAVADGVLRTTSTDWDPFLTSPVFDNGGNLSTLFCHVPDGMQLSTPLKTEHQV